MNVDDLQKAVIQLEGLRWHVAARTNYRRVEPGTSMFDFVQNHMLIPREEDPYLVCDSYDHNDVEDPFKGCSNPACWKHINEKDQVE